MITTANAHKDHWPRLYVYTRYYGARIYDRLAYFFNRLCIKYIISSLRMPDNNYTIIYNSENIEQLSI